MIEVRRLSRYFQFLYFQFQLNNYILQSTKIISSPMVVNLILYSFVWLILYYLLKIINSKYLVTANQRYNAITVIHAIYCTIFTLIYFLFFQSLTDYVAPQNQASTLFLTLAGSFYLFAVAIVFFIGRKIDWFGVVHHLVMALFISYFLYNSDLPIYYTFIAFFILPGIFYNSFLVYKEANGSNQETSELLFRLNAYAWLAFRIILFAVFVLYALYCEWLEINPRTIVHRPVLFPVLLTFCFFSSYYYVFIRRKLKLIEARKI